MGSLDMDREFFSSTKRRRYFFSEKLLFMLLLQNNATVLFARWLRFLWGIRLPGMVTTSVQEKERPPNQIGVSYQVHSCMLGFQGTALIPLMWIYHDNCSLFRRSCGFPLKIGASSTPKESVFLFFCWEVWHHNTPSRRDGNITWGCSQGIISLFDTFPNGKVLPRCCWQHRFH